MLKKREPNDQPNELIIQHFVFGLIVFLESLIKIVNLILPAPSKKIKSTALSNKGATSFNSSEREIYSSFISQKSSSDLRKILGNMDIFSTLSKRQLTDLIISNNEALKLIKIQRKRELLSKMTNPEIKVLLKGVAGISRLRKSQLIEIVLRKDKY